MAKLGFRSLGLVNTMAGANRNYELKEPQIFTEFSFIWHNNLKVVNLRKSDFIIYNIHFSTRVSCTLPSYVPVTVSSRIFFFPPNI